VERNWKPVMRKGIQSLALMLMALASIVTYSPIGHAKALGAQPVVVRRILAHNVIRIAVRTPKSGNAGPLYATYGFWETDLWEDCTAGGTYCYAVGGQCVVEPDGFAATYDLACWIQHGSTTEYLTPSQTGYNSSSNPFGEGKDGLPLLSGTWKAQLRGVDIGVTGHPDANSQGTLCGDYPCFSVDWGVTSTMSV
jgi:hypothetical protein